MENAPTDLKERLEQLNQKKEDAFHRKQEISAKIAERNVTWPRPSRTARKPCTQNSPRGARA